MHELIAAVVGTERLIIIVFSSSGDRFTDLI